MSFLQLIKIEKHIWLKIILIIYVLSFLAAFYNHFSDLIKYGFFPYQKLNIHVPPWLNVYWTLLTVFDLGAIIIIIKNIVIGLWVFLVIIISDVLINYSFVILNYGILGWLNFGQICQLLFMILVLITFLPIKRRIRELR